MKSITQITPQEILELLKKVDKKTWIRAGIIGAAGLFVFVFVIWPAWFVRPAVRHQIRTLEGQLQMTQALFLKQPQLLKNKIEYTRLILEVKARLYEPGESSLLLGAISKLAVESKVSVVASMPKDSTAKYPVPFDSTYEGNIYDFTVEGGYHNLGEFIAKIESNSKLLRVETFFLKSRVETAGVHPANISLSAISLKRAKTAK